MTYARSALSDARRMALAYGALSLVCLLARPRPWQWLVGGVVFGLVQGTLQSRVFRRYFAQIAKAQTKLEYYAPMWTSPQGRPQLIWAWVAMGLVAVATYRLRPGDFYFPLMGFFGMATAAQLLARLQVMAAIVREQEVQSVVA
jgi:hypothetical protein